MKTRLFTTAIALAALLLSACTADAQIPPNSVELKQRNADGDGWAAPRIVPQANSLLSFDAAQQPGTILISNFATIDALAALQASVTGKENTGVAASLLSAHTAAANPHTQYALSSVLANYATTSALTTGLAAKVDTSDSRLHSHANKTTLDKITESAGLPLWNGSAWPGGSSGGSYTLPAATATTLGGIKVGSGLAVTSDGTLSATAGSGGESLWTASGNNIYRATGNVGIGTSSPARLLQVNGNVWFGPAGSMGSIPDAPLNLFASQATTMLTQLRLLNIGGNAGSAIDFHTTNGGNANPGVRIGVWDDGNYSASLQIFTKTPGGNGQNNMQTVACFASNGNLGVGNFDGKTTKPAYKLDVSGDINFTGTLRKNGVEFSPEGGGAGLQVVNKREGDYLDAGKINIVTTPQEGDHVYIDSDNSAGKFYIITNGNSEWPFEVSSGFYTPVIEAGQTWLFVADPSDLGKYFTYNITMPKAFKWTVNPDEDGSPRNITTPGKYLLDIDWGQRVDVRINPKPGDELEFVVMRGETPLITTVTFRDVPYSYGTNVIVYSDSTGGFRPVSSFDMSPLSAIRLVYSPLAAGSEGGWIIVSRSGNVNIPNL